MRIGTLVMATVGTLLAGVLSAPPVGAEVGYQWRFDVRPDGLPTAAEPARTLVSGQALVWKDRETTFDASVRLGGVPTAATDAVLRVAIGTVDDGVCDETWATEVHTFEPAGMAQRADDLITFAGGFQDWVEGPERCGSVTLLSESRAVLDRLEEPGEGIMIISDPGGKPIVRKVEGLRVRPGEWSKLWLRVDYEGYDANGLTVTGRGERVKVRDTEIATLLTHGDTTWVPLRVRLTGAGPTELQIRLYAHCPCMSASGWAEVTLRPRR